MSVPTVPLELLEELERRFPNQCASIDDCDRMIWMKAGRNDVVNFLRNQYERQNRNIMKPESDNPEDED